MMHPAGARGRTAVLADLAVFLLLFAGLWIAAIATLWEHWGGGPAWLTLKLALWGALPALYARAAFGPDWRRRIGLVRPTRQALVATAAAAAAVIAVELIRAEFTGLAAFAAPLTLSAVLVPLLEELAFRGVVQERLRFAFGNAAVAVGVQAVLFTLFHMPGWLLLDRAPTLPVAASVFAIGLVTGALRTWTGSLLPGAALHLAGNLAAAA